MVLASATEWGSGSGRTGIAGTLPSKMPRSGRHGFALAAITRANGVGSIEWSNGWSRVFVRLPKLRVSVPLNLRVRLDQPERMREVAVLGRSGKHLAVEGAWTVPPTVALILEPELRQH
jgi:hypothetical protein